jgi:hypothetical protein
MVETSSFLANISFHKALLSSILVSIQYFSDSVNMIFQGFWALLKHPIYQKLLQLMMVFLLKYWGKR